MVAVVGGALAFYFFGAASEDYIDGLAFQGHLGVVVV